ncbi:(Fe-S)-binding protein [Desertihabitans aurantiacus]|uniref:(Fe-S)-binding protein n=1 Tax=Desertihabitans aurantiacus TaxID=2282477 RepID=UPI000DF72EAD|nr:(Fe-S)-binding protein [Desertihabitans aurantiacus]
MRTAAIVVALAATVLGTALFVRAVARIVGVVRLGGPTLGRTDAPRERWKHLLVETLGHTRMLQWTRVGVAHWFVFVAFGALFLTLVTAYGQLFDPRFALPVIGHWVVYEWASELIAWLGLVSILALMVVRARNRASDRSSRFYGSNTWQGVYVELTIVGITVCVLLIRALEYQLVGGVVHFPLTFFLLPAGLPTGAVETAVVVLAAVKILISMAWFAVIGLVTTMGVAWHRFTAWPNIWFKRESSGATALGALQPVNAGGTPVDFADVDNFDEDAPLGVGAVEEFTWKGLLDFTSCTECGRCQSQCPAWATGKPLSPKLLITGLRDHAHAKAPYLQAAEEARGSLPATVQADAARPLVGPIQVDGDGHAGVVDPDVLWSCTSCGACVQQCPVDIEHVDHIMDLRRFQVMVGEEFPEELTGLFKGLEGRGNPWNLNAKGRLDWTKDLDFEVPVVGRDVEDLSEVDYLFWVGCAGAYEERAKRTTQAVAELLHTAGVRFAVLGKGETCTGDPARRAGNEFVFQQLAMQNAETLTEAGATKVVATCAHCLNTLKNEYPQVGVQLEVVHHTQLLNRLVREGRLTPVAPPAGSVGGRTITYHDPCFIGRHNGVYDPPRELLEVLPDATVTEMPRNRQTAFCCGAGGARMWMEEKLGSRINVARTEEALATGATTIATGCPFCRVMLSDGVGAVQDRAGQDGGPDREVEVLDVAQLLLESVRRGDARS